jgi:signal peptidase I
MFPLGRPLSRLMGFLVDLLLLVMVVIVAILLILPLTGRQLIVIRGASMEPTIPLGGLVMTERPANPAAITAGQIVTIRTESGTVYTHRVQSVSVVGGVTQLTTKGDNNASPDGATVPASQVIGVARGWVPIAGYGVSFLQTTPGRISFFILLLAAFALRWFWDDIFGPGTAGDEPAALDEPAAHAAAA